MFIWVLCEADAKMGLGEQEISGGLWGRAAGEGEGLYKRKEREQEQAGRVYDFLAGLASLKKEGEERKIG